jgi:hypothetical protein
MTGLLHDVMALLVVAVGSLALGIVCLVASLAARRCPQCQRAARALRRWHARA